MATLSVFVILKNEKFKIYLHLFWLAFLATFMCVVKGGEGDDKERSGVFPSVDQVREGPLGVAVPSQALDESKPGRKTLDHRPDPVGVGITNVSTCRETHTRARLTFIPLCLFCRA